MSKIKTAKNVCNTTNEELMAAIRCDINTVVSAMGMLSIEVTEMNRRLGKVEPANKPVEPAPKKTTKKAKEAKKAEVASSEPPKTAHRTPASVRLTPHEITLNIGSQPVKDLAENDAKDFLNNPKVFWYRNTQFPDPKRYGVQPRIEQVKVIQRKDPKFTRAPWTVSVTISIMGDDKKAESWGVGVYTKNKADQE